MHLGTKNFENRMKKDCFMVMGTLKPAKWVIFFINNVVFKENIGQTHRKIGRFS